MPNSPLYQQSREYEQFRCLGAACEDTCCSGWQVLIDRKSYDKYRECSHPVLRPQFDQWIQIQPAAKNDGSFAKIVSKEATCPFLSENLCSVQRELGEDYLSNTCATFPRIHRRVAGVVERSLDLSCPEAARLCLADPSPASFHQVTSELADQDQTANSAETPRPYFWRIRSAFLSILQDRRFAVTKRLLLAGNMCGKLDELAAGDHHAVPQLLEGFTFGIDAGFYDAYLAVCSADAAAQLTTVLELLVARIKLDFTPRRYLDQYQHFVHGLRLKPGLNVRTSGRRYAQAFTDYYQPFIAKHEHMLEHYLVHYAYRTQFPFGS
ncbi:MAG TPA: flagellin lysine-N-methylase, partial [Bryobacteraceae bacterium]|nr:flagellin lysine-N-methylase [Bryobacteraceae bacterium]